jgi:hypothetical protein
MLVAERESVYEERGMNNGTSERESAKAQLIIPVTGAIRI